eukprot:Opistho-2@20509
MLVTPPDAMPGSVLAGAPVDACGGAGGARVGRLGARARCGVTAASGGATALFATDARVGVCVGCCCGNPPTDDADWGGSGGSAVGRFGVAAAVTCPTAADCRDTSKSKSKSALLAAPDDAEDGPVVCRATATDGAPNRSASSSNAPDACTCDAPMCGCCCALPDAPPIPAAASKGDKAAACTCAPAVTAVTAVTAGADTTGGGGDTTPLALRSANGSDASNAGESAPPDGMEVIRAAVSGWAPDADTGISGGWSPLACACASRSFRRSDSTSKASAAEPSHANFGGFVAENDCQCKCGCSLLLSSARARTAPPPMPTADRGRALNIDCTCAASVSTSCASAEASNVPAVEGACCCCCARPSPSDGGCTCDTNASKSAESSPSKSPKSPNSDSRRADVCAATAAPCTPDGASTPVARGGGASKPSKSPKSISSPSPSLPPVTPPAPPSDGPVTAEDRPRDPPPESNAEKSTSSLLSPNEAKESAELRRCTPDGA